MTKMPQTVGNVAYTYVQDAEPSSPAEGETWYDTGANAAYVWDGAAWIEETVTELTNLSDVSGVTWLTQDTQANRPAAGTEGRIYIESDTGRILYDDGTNWVHVAETDHSNLSGVAPTQHHGHARESHSFTATAGGNSTTTISLTNTYTEVNTGLGNTNTNVTQFVSSYGTNANGNITSVTIDWVSGSSSDATVYLDVQGKLA